MSSRWGVPTGLVVVLVAGLLATGLEWYATRPAAAPEDTPGAVLRGGDTGFKRVTGPRPLRFPADHGPHPDYRNEWWYFTGNLRDADGDAYGFQLTFFRSALAASMPPRPSHLATRQAWMGHFAVTDVTRGEHYFAERFQRGAAGLAGARLDPPRVWLDDWRVRAERAGSLFPLQLTARDEGMAIELRVTTERPRVLQGERGYSRKSAEAGNASYYYSYTRLRARGTLTTADGERHTVTGTAWLDREWSTSALGSEQAGWDWFALQLDDGRDLMVYRLRRHDGGTDPFSAGVVVGADGLRQRLGADEFRVEPLRWWRSPHTGARYPVVWRVRVPDAGLELRVRARLADQEMRTRFRYWEGAVTVTGRGPAAVSGVGYLEMTGYARGRAAPDAR